MHEHERAKEVVRDMLELKIRKGTFKHVESELSAYFETQKEIIRVKNEVLYGASNTDENIGGGKSNLPGDPTGRTAILLTSHKRLDHLQSIVNAIETVYEGLTPEKQILVRMKYWTRPQCLTWDGIAFKLGVSTRQAMRWRDEIVYVISQKIGWR